MVNIIKRSGWGARYTIPGNRGVARSSRRYVVWHYPGGNVGNDGAAVCRSIEQQHKNQGWDACPGYNLLISRGGLIYEGCGLDVRGIHSPPHNTDGIGVQMMLNPGEAVPPACANAGRALYDWINRTMGRTLTPWWHGRDYATSCPGSQIINWVQRGMPATGAPPAGTAPPASGGAKAPPMPADSQPWFGRSARSRSSGVRTWQQQMRNRGWSIGVDGDFGPQSDDVCRKFQREKGLTVDGMVGAQTWDRSWSAPVT
jgi:hypothetical protein